MIVRRQVIGRIAAALCTQRAHGEEPMAVLPRVS